MPETAVYGLGAVREPPYNLAWSTGSVVGWSEPPAGSTVTAIVSAFSMEFVMGVAVMFPSGWNRPLGEGGESPLMTQIWHVWSSGTEGRLSATRMILSLFMEATSASAPWSAHAPWSAIVGLCLT